MQVLPLALIYTGCVTIRVYQTKIGNANFFYLIIDKYDLFIKNIAWSLLTKPTSTEQN